MKQLVKEIRDAPFHSIRGDEWHGVFGKLHRLLEYDNPEATQFALERLATAIGSEQWRADSEAKTATRFAASRLADALAILESRRDVADCLNEFVPYFTAAACDKDFRRLLFEWMDRQASTVSEPQGWSEATLAYRIRLDGLGQDGDAKRQTLLEHLDHPSPHVRACAAKALGDLLTIRPVDGVALAEFMELVRQKELERPGLAGPFYSSIDFNLDTLPGDGQAYARIWMLSILENRKGPEPALLKYHYNGIDFHAHELFAGHPEDIRKLIDIGRTDIAVAAATEKRHVVEGLQDLLIELGNSVDHEVCRSASWHLAYHYRVLHERGFTKGFVSRKALPDETEIFFNSHPDARRYPYAAVIYPPVDQTFATAQARQWVYTLLPDSLRGEPRPFVEGPPVETLPDGGWVSGNTVHYAWSCGALVGFEGDTDKEQWRRVYIIWHGKKETWAPNKYLPA